MKKIIIPVLLICSLLFTGDLLHAQLTAKKNDSTTAAQRRRIIEGYSAEFYAGNRLENATPANVLKWATELNTELGKSWAKLSKITPRNSKETTTKKNIQDAKNLCAQIIAKGNKLSTTDAKKHDRFLFNTMSFMLNECLEANPGSECCFSGHSPSHGYGGLWYMANCFVARFPDIN